MAVSVSRRLWHLKDRDAEVQNPHTSPTPNQSVEFWGGVGVGGEAGISCLTHFFEMARARLSSYDSIYLHKHFIALCIIEMEVAIVSVPG